MRALLAATHLEPSLAVTAIACALALGAGQSPGGVALVGVTVLAGQFSVGWGNDWLDQGRDRAAGRIEKPLVAGTANPRAVRSAAFIALAVAAVASLAFGVFAAAVHLLAVGAGWAYDLRLKFTRASVVPYVVAFSLLPVFVWRGLPGSPLPPWWTVLAAGLLGAGGHFTNVLPDLLADTRTGVRGLPQRLGLRPSLAAAAALLTAGVVIILAGGDAGAPTLLAGAVSLGIIAAIVVAGLNRRTMLAFRLTIGAAGAAVAAFVLGVAD
jgi:4-hydroxybenzoate polyprenyltransferase